MPISMDLLGLTPTEAIIYSGNIGRNATLQRVRLSGSVPRFAKASVVVYGPKTKAESPCSRDGDELVLETPIEALAGDNVILSFDIEPTPPCVVVGTDGP